MKHELAFKKTRSNIDELQRAIELLESRYAAETATAIRYDKEIKGSVFERIDAINKRLSYEEVLKQRIKAIQHEIEYSYYLLYQAENSVAAALSYRHADAVNLMYLQRQSSKKVAETLNCTPQWVRTLCKEAFDYLDQRQAKVSKPTIA
ncbi:hypothetical protein [Adlercreutzia agrestimuris]|uniref:hypothetical protein n=1 Tax=Adlercreutzia agrestimuris TaxID=2941324 RepID=UPI002040A51E|nr:hypothetical protein [Adlercreutzia agrestimuris]